MAELMFSRHSNVIHSPDLRINSIPSPGFPVDKPSRRVTFTAHNTVLSPIANDPTGKRSRSENMFYYSGPRASIKPPSTANSVISQKKSTIKKKNSRDIAPQSKSLERPSWDSDVRSTSSTFDTSLKKSLLFQPRTGDRQRVVADEKNELVDRTTNNHPSLPKPLPTSQWNRKSGTRHRSFSAPSSIRQIPIRRPKDFVKLNVEKLTGRPIARNKRPTSLPRHGSVFDRLSTPLMNKSMYRFRETTRLSPSPHKSQAASENGERLLRVDIESPIIDRKPIIEHDQKQNYTTQSPIRTQMKSAPSSSSKSRVFRTASPRRQHHHVKTPQSAPNEAVKVFSVLDRVGRGRIGVNQILDGLRVLGLPATHNQVSDYVYLIHEGASSTIDLEEWSILVGTLDAAAQPAPVPTSTRELGSAFSTGDTPQSRSSPTSPPYSSNRSNSPTHSPSRLNGHDTKSSYAISPLNSNSKIVLAHADPPEPLQEDWYMEAIQRRVDEMYERAEQVVAHRMSMTGTTASTCLLEQTASAVNQLKTSLFPLVQQAEETLRDLDRHRNSKISLLLNQQDLNKIGHHSEELANGILDDLLMDIVEDLNTQERCQIQQQQVVNDVAALDAILQQLDKIETSEKELIENGYAMGYVTDTNHKTSALKSNGHSDPISVNSIPSLPTKIPESSPTKLTLPLNIIVDIDVEEAANESNTPMSEPINNTLHIIEVPEPLPLRTVSMAALSGKAYQRIDKARIKFESYRSLVESSLDATGMDQASVIEILSDMLIDDLMDECAMELDDSVNMLSDTLVSTLI